jgi:hypothetical protein
MSTMSDPFPWFVAAALALAGVVWSMKRYRIHKLPDFPDDEFGAWASRRLGIDGDEAVRDRRRLGKLLGIPSRKIPPDMPLDNLLLSMTSWERGFSLGHFEDEALEQFEDARFPGAFSLPQSAAEWVEFRARVRAAKKGQR